MKNTGVDDIDCERDLSVMSRLLIDIMMLRTIIRSNEEEKEKEGDDIGDDDDDTEEKPVEDVLWFLLIAVMTTIKTFGASVFSRETQPKDMAH